MVVFLTPILKGCGRRVVQILILNDRYSFAEVPHQRTSYKTINFRFALKTRSFCINRFSVLSFNIMVDIEKLDEEAEEPREEEKTAAQDSPSDAADDEWTPLMGHDLVMKVCLKAR